MGADFLCAYVPHCDITDERRRELNQIIEGQVADDMPDYEDDLASWRERLTDALDNLDPEGREVVQLMVPGADYEILLSGGMSWGDSPTEAMDEFCDIGNCRALFRAMEDFAREDRLAYLRKKRSHAAK